MSHLKGLYVLSALLLLVGAIRQCALAGSSTQPASPNSDSGGGVAIVELFTSEGCSSCPPADELVTELQKSYGDRGKSVLFLAFHVDYWDHIGWKDPFGDAAFSKRQREYSSVFRSDSVYTPQMVVNGAAEFVGSDRRMAVAAIDKALAAGASVPVSVAVGRGQDDRELSVRCHVDDVPRDALLNVGVVESQLSSKVARGENGGRTLRHDQVVRLFQQQPLTESNQTIKLTLPSAVSRDRARLIVFVQERASLKVLGAAGADIPKETRK